jgi:hypothetical protein
MAVSSLQLQQKQWEYPAMQQPRLSTGPTSQAKKREEHQ